VPLAAFGVVSAGAAWAGGQWPATLLVLLLVAAAFTLVLNRPHIGLSLFLTTFLINYPGVARGVGPLTINNVLGSVFIAMLGWHYYRTRDAWYLREPLVRTLLLIGAILLLGTLAAQFGFPDDYIQQLMRRADGGASADFTRRWLFQYFSRVAFVVFMLHFVQTPSQLRTVFLTLLGCILAAVPPALLQFSQGSTGAEFRIDVEIVNWADNENRFAFGCILGTSLLLYLASGARSAAGKLAALTGIFLLLPLVLLAASRSGFLGMCLLGFLVLVGAYGTKQRRVTTGSRAIGVLAIAAVALLTFTFLLPEKAQERVLNVNPFAEEHLEGSTSTGFRTAAIGHSWNLFRMNPVLGVGLGNFRWVNRYYHGYFKPPHNSYLWAAAEGGVLLVAAYFLLFVQLWRRLGRLCGPYSDDRELAFFPHWLRIYMVLFLFFSLFADVWIEEHVFLLSASAILLERWRREHQTGERLVPAHAPLHPAFRRGTTIQPVGAA
jgi:hypothetical protein